MEQNILLFIRSKKECLKNCKQFTISRNLEKHSNLLLLNKTKYYYKYPECLMVISVPHFYNKLILKGSY